MFKRLLLLLPALAGAALLATRLVPGPLRDGTTQLASGWRIRPAGRQVTVGTLPLNLLALSDGSVLVTNNGYGENGLMRIDPVSAQVVWRTRLPAAWLGLARAGGGWRDTVWASGGATNRVYRFVWQGGAAWATDSEALADSGAKLFAAGIALLRRQGLVAVVGNLSDAVYLLDAATLQRRGAGAWRRRAGTRSRSSCRRPRRVPDAAAARCRPRTGSRPSPRAPRCLSPTPRRPATRTGTRGSWPPRSPTPCRASRRPRVPARATRPGASSATRPAR